MPGLHHIRHYSPLAAILLLGAGLRLWNLQQNGYGTEYYAAGVHSMLGSLHHFFYLSFDPTGFVSLDKPPLAFWLQAISAWLFGFSGWSLLLPQVIEGLCAIALLHHLVARCFGSAAALIAALCLALTPVSVAVDRSGNTDSALALLLLLSSWALLRAIETQRLRWLLLTAVFGGLAFNTKMLVAFVLLPAFVLVWWRGTAMSWQQRLKHLALTGIVLTCVSLSWAIAFDLKPSGHRPYAGSSVHNSMLELTVIHNGLERFRPRTPTIMTDSTRPAPQFYDAVPVGPLRLADRHLAAQVLWLLPLSLIGLVATWRRGDHKTDLLLWSLWLLSYGIVFSAAGGIFHAYYLVALAPPLAALTGIGIVTLWPQRHWLLGALALCIPWQAYIAAGNLSETDAYDPAFWLLLLPSIAGFVALLMPHRITAGIALGMLLLNPLLWSASNAAARGYTMLPAADLDRLTGRSATDGTRHWRRLATETTSPVADPKLIAFLQANRSDERFALVTTSTRLAAPLILQDLPVMAYGGFNGNDPILTLDEFARRVTARELRFVLLSTGLPTGAGPVQLNADDPRRQFASWVRAHGQAVHPRLWRSTRFGESDERAGLYDLRPDAGLQATR